MNGDLEWIGMEIWRLNEFHRRNHNIERILSVAALQRILNVTVIMEIRACFPIWQFLAAHEVPKPSWVFERKAGILVILQLLDAEAPWNLQVLFRKKWLHTWTKLYHRKKRKKEKKVITNILWVVARGFALLLSMSCEAKTWTKLSQIYTNLTNTEVNGSEPN